MALTNNAFNSDAYKKAGGNHLFAADIRNNVIQVFDNKWKDVTEHLSFSDPGQRRHLHPFNIVDLGGHLFVAYAEFDPDSDEGQEQVLGAGLGHVVEYNEDGTLVKDFHAHGVLNAPWGMAIAPASFGKFANDLLVANFGDGTISAFDLDDRGFRRLSARSRHQDHLASMASGASPSAMASAWATPTPSTSPPGRTTKKTACSAA